MLELEVSTDFLSYTSFPNSVKCVNRDVDHRTRIFSPDIPVMPGSLVRAEVKARTENVSTPRDLGSWISIMGSPDGKNWIYMGAGFTVPQVPGTWGTRDWMQFKFEMKIPADILFLRCHFACAPGITWFDDLKIFQDDELIYSNDFSNWTPLIGTGIGACVGGAAAYLLNEPLGPIVSEAVGAFFGGALGGSVGLLTTII